MGFNMVKTIKLKTMPRGWQLDLDIHAIEPGKPELWVDTRRTVAPGSGGGTYVRLTKGEAESLRKVLDRYLAST
jgi:hypothetical protein